jgi:hypothetical protein
MTSDENSQETKSIRDLVGNYVTSLGTLTQQVNRKKS